MLRTLHVADRSRSGCTLRIDSRSGQICLAVEVPAGLKSVVLPELQDSYPGLEVRPGFVPRESPNVWTRRLRKSPDVFSLRTTDEFCDDADRGRFADPLSGILTSLQTGYSGRVGLSVQLTIRPATARRVRSAGRIRKTLARRFRPECAKAMYLRLATSHQFLSRLIGQIVGVLCSRKSQHGQNGPETAVEAWFECSLVLRASGDFNAAQIAGKRLDEIVGAFARYHRTAAFVPGTHAGKRGFLMTASEIAALWHPVTISGDGVSRVRRTAFRELEPPVELAATSADCGGTVLGRVSFRQQRNVCRIEVDDLRRHLIAVGKTGSGKSTFLFNIVQQQMAAGRGVVLIDPHGQLADDVLDAVPRQRTNDVVFFDTSDRTATVGFNPMVGPPGTDESLIADGVLTSFRNVFGLQAGTAPRLLHIFRNCLLSLIGTPQASLSSVQRMLVDASFRKSIMAQVSNRAVRDFWLLEFQRWNERDRTQYIASLQNKLGAFLTNDRLLKIIDAGQHGIQLRQIMDRSGILICNLSKGTFGHDASTLLGSLMLSSLHLAAMSRADMPESDRVDCVIVVDEFHSYLADGNTTMADALAESRKYRTSYVLSTQLLEGQLDEATLAGVLGNCGSTFCMTVGPRDADVLCDLLGGGLTADDLQRIPKYHGYLRMLIDGAPHTFSVRTLPPTRGQSSRGRVIRRVSRQRYGRKPDAA